jgi:serine protease Do
VLGEYPSKEQRASVQKPDSDSSLQGVNVESLTPETAQELKLPATTKGVVVSEVDPSSHAADAGLRPGDVIQQVNHQPVANMREYTQAVSASKKDDSVLLLVDRNGNTLFLAV